MNFLKKQKQFIVFVMVMMSMPALQAAKWTQAIKSLTRYGLVGIFIEAGNTSSTTRYQGNFPRFEYFEEDKAPQSEDGMTVYLPGYNKVTFKDVAGQDAAKADLQDIISYLKNSDIYHKIGAKIPKGVLMYGDPGCGKTLLARAVAGEANCAFISLSGAIFKQKYIGDAETLVRKLFDKAARLSEQYKACIIFIDEIDSVASKRVEDGVSPAANREYNSTIDQFLYQMDGFERQKDPIVIIGATNRVEVLDEAFIRPGRFDRKVEVTKPYVQDRVTLLNIALKDIVHDKNLDIDKISQLTRGFSGAELTLLANEAAILAANKGKSVVQLSDIELAFDNITLGREVAGMQQNENAKWKTAIHEAGHAIAWSVVQQEKYAIYKVSIVPRSNSLGMVYAIPLYESYESTEEEMKARIVVALCGGIAEEEFGFGKSSGPSDDLKKARSIAYDMVVKYGMSESLGYLSYDNIDAYLPNDVGTKIHAEVKKIIDECSIQAKTLITKHKKEIENIARLLLNKGTISGAEVYQLLGKPTPKLV